MRHVLGVGQFDRRAIDEILASADAMRQVAAERSDQRLRGKIMATLFYEPSTRTRLSFESAMYRLGGHVISSEMAAETSSAAKGETIEDTVRIVESYADLIVIRHPEAGAADRAATVASVPIINAGDGPSEHPTQALIDLFTIYREFGRIDDLDIALVGDLRYGRAPRSLATALSRCRDISLTLVAPAGLEMGADVLEMLAEARINYRETQTLDEALSADVVYITRIQKERFQDPLMYEQLKGAYVLRPEDVEKMKPESIMMHPLPRVDEIAPGVDADQRAAYFRQARNGVFVRMALLDRLLGV